MRRADMADRGRRFMPKGGKYGTITITNNTSSLRFYTAFTPVTYATFECTDADSGNKQTVVASSSNPLPSVTWESANGGTAVAKLPGVLTSYSGRNWSINCFEIKGGNKWSDFTTLNLQVNQLKSLTTYKWPSLIKLDLANNPFEENIKTFEWPNLEFLQLPATYDGFETHEWPKLERFSLGGPITELETHDWPNMTYFSVNHCEDLKTMNLQRDWSSLVELNISYTSFTDEMLTSNTWTSIEKIVYAYGYANPDTGYRTTSFETHPEWTKLQYLSFGYLNIGYNGGSNVETHAEWVDLELLAFTKCGGYQTAVEVHPEWTKFSYFKGQNMVISAANIDEILIAIDDSGAQGGTWDSVYIAGSTYAADSYRSASANTAISNLVAKGWTYTR